MAKQPLLIRIMGESDIVDVNIIKNDTKMHVGSALLVGLDRSDTINLLGHWTDHDRGATLAGDTAHFDAMKTIAVGIVTESQFTAQLEAGANFVLLTILREKWPVGLKAKFRLIADRVNADHTYIAHVCGAATLDNLSDRETLKRAETSQLSIALSFFKGNRRRFANSSAVQALIKR